MASYPSYNPNNPNRKPQKNGALLDKYEPGSVLKPIAMAKAIDMELINIDDSFDTSPGYISLNNYSIISTKKYNFMPYNIKVRNFRLSPKMKLSDI